MNQDVWAWLRASKSRVDLSGERVTISAFASEPTLVVNAAGADISEAFASCKAKVKNSNQAAAAARSLFTKAVNKAYHLFLDGDGVEAANKAINGARKNLSVEEAFFEESNANLRLIAGDNVELNNRLEMSPNDEETKASVALSDEQLKKAKSRAQEVNKRVDAAKAALSEAEAGRARFVKNAKDRARLTGDAKKFKEFLMIMGRWHDDSEA